MKPAVRTSAYILLIICVGVVVYLPAFQASFHLDDGPSIRDNVVLRRLDPEAIFNYWPTRFFTYLSLAVTFRYAGLDQFLYHLGNIVIHIFNGLVVYFLLRRLPGKFGPLSALIGTLIFLVHPLQTQAATYVIQRATSLAGGFFLLSILFYLKAFQVKKNRQKDNADISTRFKLFNYIYYLLSLLFAVCAMFTKEFTITLPGTLILTELLVPRDLQAARSKKFIRLIPFLLMLLIIPAVIQLYSANPHYNDSGQIEWMREAGVVGKTAPGHGESPRIYLLTQSRVFITYLRLLALPINQQVDYDYPKILSLFEPGVFICLTVIISLVIIAIYFSKRKNLMMAGFGISWFILTLLPESSIIPIIDVIVEHRLYLPLFGVVLVFASIYGGLARFRRSRLILAAAIIFFFGWLTYQRNLVWKDPVSLWEDNVAKAPGRARIHGNLGKAYLDKGRYERAAEEFKKLIEIDPTFASAYNNLAVIYIDHLKDDRIARKYIEASLTLFPDYPAGYVNLGVIDLNNRKLRSAIKNFEKALELDPGNLLAYYNLGACYINLGDLYAREAASLHSVKKEEIAREKEVLARAEYRRAEEFLRRGLSIWPEDPRFNLLLARLYKGMGKTEEAEAYFDKTGMSRE